jgi:hypothetical protein
MEKVSDKLSFLIDSERPEKEIKLNVMLRKDLDSESLSTLTSELAELATDKESLDVLPALGILLMKGTLGAVEHIAKHPGVEWVDKDTEAPIEDLLDA